MDTPTIQLKSGSGAIPQIGLGTWKSEPNKVGEAVRHAIANAGYRHIDCAEVYGNEAEVGQVLNELFTANVVKREDLFITTKVFNNNHRDRVNVSVNKSLHDLQLNYVDLLLVHWPIAFETAELPTPMRLPDGTPHPSLKTNIEFLDTWKYMEEEYQRGTAKAIGVSNFTIPQLQELLEHSVVKPAVNQVEFHPLLFQSELLEFCRQHGITVVAYSPLGSPDSYSGKLPGAPSLLTTPLVTEIAAAHNKSPAQILIRWSIQKGLVVIPKSVTPHRIIENAAVFDFSLTEQESTALDGLNINHRFGLGWMPGHFWPLPSASE